MNEKNIKALLKGSGYTSEVLDNLDKDELDTKQAVEKLNASHKEHYESLLSNEIESRIKDEISQKRDGKLFADVNQLIKKQGVPFDEVKDLELKEKIAMLVKHVEEKTQKSAGAVAEDYKKAQEEIVGLKNQLTEKDEWAKGEIEKAQQTAKSEVLTEKVDMKQRTKFFSIPEEKLIGKKHNEGLYMAYRSIASTKFDFDLDENGEVIAYKKGTKTRVTGKNEEGKEHFISIDDLMKSELTSLGLWVQSNGQGGGSGGHGGQGQGGSQGQGGTQPKKSQRMIELEKVAAQS